jgi:hypothetical protein
MLQMLQGATRWFEHLDDPNRYKLMTALAGDLADKCGGMTMLAALISLPLIDAARSLDRIANTMEASKK